MLCETHEPKSNLKGAPGGHRDTAEEGVEDDGGHACRHGISYMTMPTYAAGMWVACCCEAQTGSTNITPELKQRNLLHSKGRGREFDLSERLASTLGPAPVITAPLGVWKPGPPAFGQLVRSRVHTLQSLGQA